MSCDCPPFLTEALQALGNTPAGSASLPDTRMLDLRTAPDKRSPAPDPTPPSPACEPCQLDTAQALCEACRIRLKPAAAELLQPDDTPRRFFQKLVQADCLADARRILAHALPKRRALWWGCLAARDVDTPAALPGINLALPAVVRFILDPREEHRQATLEAGKRAGVNTLAGSLAMAAFFSRGSVSLPHLPSVPPRPFVTGRLIGVTIYLASVTRDAARYKEHLRGYLQLGEQIARGRLLWHPGRSADRDRARRCDPNHPTARTSPHFADPRSPCPSHAGQSSRGERPS